MLRHRNYLTISFFFLLTFFLFQVVVYDSAVAATDIDNKELNLSWQKNIDTTQLASEAKAPENAVITGSTEAGQAIGKDMATIYGYVKQPAKVYRSIDEITDTELNSYYSIAIATADVDDIGSLDRLLEYNKNGGHLMFTQMPSQSAGNYARLEPYLGIYENGAPYIHEDGFEFYEGLLLGGPYAAEDTEILTNPVKLYGKCKTYGVCIDEEIVRNEDKNPIVWRTYNEKGAIFVVNGPFMTEKEGLGLLVGFLSDLRENFLYPIINAKATVLNNFPYITSTNDEHLKERYNRVMKDFVRDIMWADLVSIMRDSNLAYTCYVSESDYSSGKEYNKELLEFLARELSRNKGELGYTVPKGTPSSIPALLKRDSEFFKNTLNSYKIKTFSAKESFPFTDNKSLLSGSFPEIATLTADLHTVDFGYTEDKTLTVPYTSRGFYNTDAQRWSAANMVTVMGVLIHEMDMDLPIQDNDPDHVWREAAVEVSKYLNWQKWKYGWMPSYKMSEFSKHVQNYLHMNVTITYEESKTRDGVDKIHGKIENFSGEGTFLMRTEKEIKYLENCGISIARKDEPGIYLIYARAADFTITLAEWDQK